MSLRALQDIPHVSRFCGTEDGELAKGSSWSQTGPLKIGQKPTSKSPEILALMSGQFSPPKCPYVGGSHHFWVKKVRTREVALNFCVNTIKYGKNSPALPNISTLRRANMDILWARSKPKSYQNSMHAQDFPTFNQAGALSSAQPRVLEGPCPDSEGR